MKVALAGGTGVLGSRVLPRLLERGHQVRLLLRRPVPAAAAAGVTVVEGDLLDAAAVRAWADGADVALHLATALSAGASGAIDWATNDAVRRQGTANVVAACARQGVRRLVAQSVAFVAQAAPSDWSEGAEALQARPFLASAAELEAQVRAAPTPSVVLRGGFFYGAGTSLGETRRVPVGADDHVSLVHVADMAAAVVAAAEGGATGTYAVVDDRPPTGAELAALLGVPAGGGRPILASFRVRNRAIKEAFGWAPAFASIRIGIAEEAWWLAARRHR